MRKKSHKKIRNLALASLALGIALIGFALNPGQVLAQSQLHPVFPLLDADGVNVLESNSPVSTMATCGQCHNTEFIASHSFHADAGLSEMTEPGDTVTGRAWDFSTGIYGKWNPISYRYITQTDDQFADLDLESWLQTVGLRHVGGGPAEEAGIDMNCFLCHTTSPDNAEREHAIESGEFAWANTATLAGSGIVSVSGQTYSYNADAFEDNGSLKTAYVQIQDPSNQNCGQCHGTVHGNTEPVVITGCEDSGWETAATGQVFASERLAESGMNLEDKNSLTRSWDIHIERLVDCTDCHYSINNPIYTQGSGADSLEHLDFDPRRLDIGEYLLQPSHEFARGQSAQSSIAPELVDTMRRCESCHNPNITHDWLPYADQHMEAIHCETCHIPDIYAPAIEQVDWTVIEADGTAQTTCRGVEGNTGSITDLVTGYSPTMLQRENIDGTTKLAPYNLVSSWFWVYGDPAVPVPQAQLEEAFLSDGDYKSEIIAALDSDNSGAVEKSELMLDTDEKVAVVAGLLEDLGLDNPRIQAEVQPYSINHNVAGSEYATRDCETCHTEKSRLAEPIQLAAYVPGGVTPDFVSGANTITDGDIYVDEDGALYYQPAPETQDLYIFGHNKVSWIDWAGILMFLGVLGGVSVHGGMRALAARKRAKHEPELKKIYMYTFYERLWHWLQTITILVLAFTGLVIHKPEMFGMFSFKGVVLVHNIMAALLVANATLALIYNLISGDIKRFIPEPKGFFNQAIVQAKFYINGIFKGEEHPFEKTREKRLNPLQIVTYVAVLNVLLPLQVITGILMWGVQQWPQIAIKLGGLPFLAPLHTLVAWSFISFIIAHVYLTTTGHTPMAGIKSMVIGWDEVEVHSVESDHTESDQTEEK